MAKPESRRFGMVFGAASAKAIITGEKTSTLVSTKQDPWAKRLRPGMAMDVQAWSRNAEDRRRGQVRIAGVCFHRSIGDIPACSRGHRAEAFNPAEPHWARVISLALSHGGRISDPAQQRAASDTGWIVLDFTDPQPTP